MKEDENDRRLILVAVIFLSVLAAIFIAPMWMTSGLEPAKITSVSHSGELTTVYACEWRDSVSRGLYWDCDKFGSTTMPSGLAGLRPPASDLYVTDTCWNSLSQTDKDIINSWSTFRCVVSSSWTPLNGDPCPPPPSPAQIEDENDTLTFDKTSYQLGETVNMYATGTNIGGEEWHGKVTFTITQPDGSVYAVEEASGVAVAAGSSATAGETFMPPTTGQSGTWTAQSGWITDEGVTDARSSIIDLETEGAEDNTIWIIGGIAAFLLLLYFAFRKTKR